MKRSEANKVLRARVEFSREYTMVNTVEDSEEYFSRTGCDICPDRLAGSVVDVRYLALADTTRDVFDNVHEGQLCGGCLCSVVNGDDSDLDYYVTDEDEPVYIFPSIGMPATELLLTDRVPYTVTRVFSDDRIELTEDKVKHRDGRKLYVPGDGDEKITATRRKNGHWVIVGRPMNNGRRFKLGERTAYRGDD